jgi:hypothetical protein
MFEVKLRKVPVSVAEPERRIESKLPPGAGGEITNCGSGSFLTIKDLKKFIEKNHAF